MSEGKFVSYNGSLLDLIMYSHKEASECAVRAEWEVILGCNASQK